MGSVHKAYVFAMIFVGSVLLSNATAQAQVGACCKPGSQCEDGVDAAVCLKAGGQPFTGESCKQITCQNCLEGTDCNDNLPCTEDQCVGGICRHDPIVGSCDDGDPCTLNDVCEGRDCIGISPSLVFDDYPASPIGQALLSPDMGNLAVSNIGKLDPYGVAICFGGNPAGRPAVAGAEWVPMVVPGSAAGITPPPKQKSGAKGEESSSNLAGAALPDEPIGVEFEQTKAGDFAASTLFAAVGATTASVQLLRNGNIVDEVNELPTSAPVVFVSDLPTAVHVGWIGQSDNIYFAVVARFASPVTVAFPLPGSLTGTVMVDELRFIPENPVSLPTTFERFELEVTTIPRFTLIDVIDRLPVIIPTLSSIGVVVLGVLFVLCGTVMARRRLRMAN